MSTNNINRIYAIYLLTQTKSKGLNAETAETAKKQRTNLNQLILVFFSFDCSNYC
jgi:hypothetical protein